MTDSSYSFSLTTFSPSGKLLQIEYALKAVSQGTTCIGIRSNPRENYLLAKNGVVLGSEKVLQSTLIESETIQKIVYIAEHIGILIKIYKGVVYSGLGPDFRVLIKKARKKAVQYYQIYNEKIPVLLMVLGVASIMQEYTQSGGVRPFGVSLLVAGFDHQGPQLYQVDPSGAYFGWKASSLGLNSINAKSFLEKRYNDELEIEDGIHNVLLTLKEGFDGEMNENNIQIGIIGTDSKFRLLTTEEVKDYIAETE